MRFIGYRDENNDYAIYGTGRTRYCFRGYLRIYLDSIGSCMKLKANTIKIEFDKKDDWWMAQCSDGIELEDAVRMVREAWADHETPLIKDETIRKAVSAWCRNHGYCWICRRNRLHKRMVELLRAKDKEDK